MIPQIQIAVKFCVLTSCFDTNAVLWYKAKVETQEKQIDEYRKDNFNLKYELQELKHLFEKLINFLKRMFHRKDKEDVYAEVVDDMYHNQIISEKTFDRITGWGNEKDKQKDDFEL